MEEYKEVSVNVTRAEDVSLTLYKTSPEFSGEREKYATWRSVTQTAMKLLENHQTTMKYFEALMIVRNKITGANILNSILNSYNFNAIIDRLDFTYADKRPLYILEQELLVLQQDKISLEKFFDEVNENTILYLI